jgi:hypothetical protein
MAVAGASGSAAIPPQFFSGVSHAQSSSRIMTAFWLERAVRRPTAAGGE